MALTRRSGNRITGSIWPGFVDALTALLLILMFVLSIFMIIQFSLRERLTGQDKILEGLNSELVAKNELIDDRESQIDTLTVNVVMAAIGGCLIGVMVTTIIPIEVGPELWFVFAGGVVAVCAWRSKTPTTGTSLPIPP